jgi:nucleoside-diphosphate-sugar epimerase
VGRALLIGGAGFIGSHLARELVRRDVEVVVVDDDRTWLPSLADAAARARAWRRRTLLPGVPIRAGGPDDEEALRRHVAAVAPSVVVHLANLALAGVAARDPAAARESIVAGTGRVLRAVAASAPDARVTFVSSSMVYGDFTADPQPETAPLRPREPYGACKLDAEQLVRASALDWTIVRPSAVYGPGDGNGRFVQRLVEGATSGRPLELTADPETRLDFTWVGDLAAGLACAATAPAASRRTFNLTFGGARSLGEAIAIVRAHGHDLVVRPRATATVRPRRGTLDVSAARAALGYTPAWSLEDGLAAYLAAAADGELAA